jgi:phosphatidylserine/phosphatidylglycerophosphate/cardiolipin synthase-like enzyme
VVFVLIGFGGGYFAGAVGPGRAPADRVAEAPASTASARCYFSPRGGCTDAIVDELNAAQHTIELQGFSFTSRPIGSALVAAARRGVHVTVVLDAVQTSEHRGEPQYISNHGVPVLVDSRHAMAHNKVILIDGRTLITGSFNFTRAAEEDNAENLLVLHDQPKLQSAYEDNFRRHLEHAERFEGR